MSEEVAGQGDDGTRIVGLAAEGLHDDGPEDGATELLDRGVLVRDVGIPGHLRVSAGTEAETTAFLDALASIGSAS